MELRGAPNGAPPVSTNDLRRGLNMAELTALESKIGEVLGLAMAAQGATDKVSKLVEEEGEHDDLRAALQRMHEEARETEERTTELAESIDGKKTAILEEAREGSLELAADEDPNEPA